jgi:hypothetical protein
MADTSLVEPADALAEFKIELAPPLFKEIYDGINPKYKEWNEYELRKEVRIQCNDDMEIFRIVTRIRLAFWKEYERAARAGVGMSDGVMIRTVCKKETLYNLLQSMQALSAWIVCPIIGFLLARKELEMFAQERMLEILSVSAVRADGKVDSRLAQVQANAYENLQNRIYGAVTQKIQSEQKSVNVNLSGHSQGAQKAIGEITDIAEIERRIQTIQEKRKLLQTVPQPIEVDTARLINPDREKV